MASILLSDCASIHITLLAIMIKKLIALAATSLVSLSASAGYVQYDFSGQMRGYFIQHDDDGSIADFKFSFLVADAFSQSPDGFYAGFFPTRSEGYTSINGGTTYFRNNGPTNFTLFSNFGADQSTQFSIEFDRATQGNFSYIGQYQTSIYYNDGWRSYKGTVTGLVSESSVAPLVAQNLDYFNGYAETVNRVVPTFINPNRVPEPGSLALLAIGAVGAIGAARHRKTA